MRHGPRPAGRARRSLRSLGALLLPLVLACRGWTSVPPDRIGSQEAVWVQTRCGEEIRLTEPRLIGDSLLTGWAAEPAPGERTIPLSSVARVEAYGMDAAGTVQVVLITTTVVGFLWVARLLTDDGGVS